MHQVFQNRNKLIANYQNVRFICIGLDISFIIIHSFMFALFWYHKVLPMYVFNVFSVLLYCFLPILLYKNHFSTFVQLMHLEVVTHMTLSIYFVGWDSGFQITILGFNIFLVWAEYVATTLHLKKVHSLILCLISATAYIGSAVLNHYHTPQYLMPPESAYRLRVAWAVIVFIITIFFLQLFAYLASGMQKQLIEEALHDKLTGLHNRYYMSDYLENVVKKEKRWLAIADIDNFKDVNDLYGHNCGDYVLKTVAELAQNREPKAEICRWGGEEFLVVAEAEPEQAFEWLDGLRRQVEEYDFVHGGHTIHLTITIGVASGKTDESVESWVDRADKKLYEGKSSGKNKVITAV